jgi:hypothetical protein
MVLAEETLNADDDDSSFSSSLGVKDVSETSYLYSVS